MEDFPRAVQEKRKQLSGCSCRQIGPQVAQPILAKNGSHRLIIISFPLQDGNKFLQVGDRINLDGNSIQAKASIEIAPQPHVSGIPGHLANVINVGGHALQAYAIALIALLLFPIVWLMLIPFRLLGITVSAVLDLFKAVITLPARLLRGPARS